MESRTSSRAGTSRTRRAGTGAAPGDIGSAGDRGVEPGTVESTGARTASSADTPASGAPSQEPSSGLVNRIKARATTQLSTQKDRATEGIGTLAHAVRETTAKLRDEKHDTAAEYVERAAEQLERWSNGLREKDVTELLQDAQRLARRQPALFIGGSFAAGLLMARFLKSSRERERTGEYGWAESRTGSGMPEADLPGAY